MYDKITNRLYCCAGAMLFFRGLGHVCCLTFLINMRIYYIIMVIISSKFSVLSTVTYPENFISLISKF